jgi:hypothetical protein
MDQLISLIVQLIGGAAGGNAVGGLLKNTNMTTLLRTLVGVVGGIGGTQLAGLTGILQNVLGDAATSTGGIVASNAGASAVGGAALTLIVGFIKQYMASANAKA